MLGKELSSKPSMKRSNAFNRVEAHPILLLVQVILKPGIIS